MVVGACSGDATSVGPLGTFARIAQGRDGESCGSWQWLQTSGQSYVEVLRNGPIASGVGETRTGCIDAEPLSAALLQVCLDWMVRCLWVRPVEGRVSEELALQMLGS